MKVFKLTGEAKYRDTAIRQLDWVIAQQQENGWFQYCSFGLTDLPITHTIAYTIEGLIESAILTSKNRYFDAGKKAADQLLNHLEHSGFLAGAFSHQSLGTDALRAGTALSF